jgi:hypothetical protein
MRIEKGLIKIEVWVGCVEEVMVRIRMGIRVGEGIIVVMYYSTRVEYHPLTTTPSLISATIPPSTIFGVILRFG